jgi:hypothetical protein
MSTPPRSLEDILGKDWDKSQPPPTEETLVTQEEDERTLEDILGISTEEGETEEVEEPKIEDPNFINRLAERQRDLYAKYPALAQAIKSTVGALPPGLDVIADISPIELEEKQEKVKTLGTSLLSGGKSFRSQFLQLRAKRAEKRGDDKKSKELLAKAAEKEEEAAELSYESKYGDVGLEQFKNMSDPLWWYATMGEAAPSSAPFLTGAGATAYATSKVTKNPYALIAAAAFGGGSAVMIQEYGDAYYDYLEKNPGDLIGAKNYAWKTSGISAFINAASIPASLAGMSLTPLKHFLTQALIQGSIGTLDTVVQNRFIKQHIDPELDVTTGLLKSAVGEGLFEAPILVKGVRHSLPRRNKKDEKANKEWKDEQEVVMSNNAENRISQIESNVGPLEQLTEQDLQDLIEEQELEVGRVIKGESRESLLGKVEEAIFEQERAKIIDEYMQDTVLMDFYPEKIYAKYKRNLEALSKEEFNEYILREFGTQEAFLEWTRLHGAYNALPNSIEVNVEQAKKALAASMTDRELRTKGDAIWLLGKNEFNDYVKDIDAHFDIKELRRQAINVVPGVSETNVKKMTKMELSERIAEQKAIIQQQRLKKEKMGEPTWEEIGGQEVFDANPAVIFDFVSEFGQAIEAEVTIENPNGSQTKLLFSRQGLDTELTLGEAQEKGGAKLSETNAKEMGREDLANLTIEQVLQSVDNSWVSGVLMPEAASKKLHGGIFITKFFNKYMRPLTPIGALMGSAYKQMRGRLRALDSAAEFQALQVQRAILKARQNGEVDSKEEADKLIMAFLRQTGAKIKLSKEEKKAVKDRIAELGKADLQSISEELNISIEEAQKEVNSEIAGLEEQLQGIQRTGVAARQLPKSLRKVAREIRSGIDNLTKRILTELDQTSIKDETKVLMQEMLNVYVTRGYKIAEPSLGWNPKFAVAIEKAQNNKPMTKLYDRAVISQQFQMRDRLPSFVELARTEMVGQEVTEEEITARGQELLKVAATRKIDDLLQQVMYEQEKEIASIASVLAPTKKEGAPIRGGGKLLESRAYVPFAIRELLGEIKEADLVAATSFARMAKLIETAKFFTELKKLNNMAGEMWFSPIKTKEFTKLIDTGDDLNPLNGYYTTEEMYNTLAIQPRLAGKNAIWSAYQLIWGGSKAGVQYGMIVLSPGTQMRNFYGAAMMYGFNGNMIGGDLKETVELIYDELFGRATYNPVTGEIIEGNAEAQKTRSKAQQLGLGNTEVRSNDIVGVFHRMKTGDINNVAKAVRMLYAIGQSGPGAAFNPIIKLNRFAKRAYGASDDFFKWLAWGAERIKLRKVVDSLGNVSDDVKLKVLRGLAKNMTIKSSFKDAGPGVYKQDVETILRNVDNLNDYIEGLAAYIVRNTMPNYDYVGEFAEYLRLSPYGNFIAFPTEIARTSANSAMFTYRLGKFKLSDALSEDELGANNLDGGTHPFKWVAAQRAIGGITYSHGLPYGLKFLAQAITGVDDDDIEAARAIGPEYGKDQMIIPMSKVRPEELKGGFRTFNGNYVFPYQDLANVYMVINRLQAEGEYGLNHQKIIDNALVQFVASYSKAYTGEAIAWKTLTALTNNLDDTTDPYNPKPIRNITDDWGEQVTDMIKFALKNAGPGAYRQVNDVIWSLRVGDEALDKFGRTMEFEVAAAKLMGLSSGDVDPTSSMPFIITSVKKEHDQWVKENMSKEAFSKQALDKETVLDDYMDAQRAWFNIQQELYFKLQAAKKLKVDPKVYWEELDRLGQIAGINKKDIIGNIEKGVFTPWTIPKAITNNFEEAKVEYNLTREWPYEEINALATYYWTSEIKLVEHTRLPNPGED